MKAEGISKRSKNDWLFRDVSLECVRGEVFGIFGTSKARATTLLRVLAGVEKPDDGRVYAASDTRNWQDSIRYVGPSGHNGFFRALRSILTRENGNGRQIAEVEDALRSDAEVLCFDDPLHCVEHGRKDAMIEKIRAAAADKRVIVASSDFEQILRLADRAVVLGEDEIVQAGTPESIYLQPTASVVAAATGRCNLFGARRLSSSKAEVPEFQSVVGEHRLSIGRTEKSRLGALNRNITLAIRPEHVSISFGASFPEDNLLKAVVIEVRFLGPHTLVKLDAGGLRLEALVMRLVGLEPGDECMISMPPDRIILFAG